MKKRTLVVIALLLSAGVASAQPVPVTWHPPVGTVDGEYLKWNGTLNRWVGSGVVAGDITSVGATAGGGLTGGATSGPALLGLITTCTDGQVLKSGSGSWNCGNDLSGGITNSAGANVVMKSDGTNAVASSITDDGTTVTLANTLTVGDGTGQDLIINNTGAGSYGGLALREGGTDRWNILKSDTSDDFVISRFDSSGVAQGIELTIASATGDVTLGDALTVTGLSTLTGGFTLGADSSAASHKITSLANGTVSTDAAAFGQIATAVNAAVSGTSGRSARFTGTNTVGTGAFTDDGTNASIAGTFDASAAVTLNGTSGTTRIGAGTDAATFGAATQLIVENNGSTNLAVRDATNNVELQNYAYSGGGIIGTKTAHSFFIQANGTSGIQIATNGAVTVLTSLTNNGNTTLGDASTDIVTITSGISGRVRTVSSPPTVSTCGTGPSAVGSNLAGRITVGSGAVTACTLTFATAFATTPACVVTGKNNSGGDRVYISAESTTAITVATSSTGLGNFNYVCFETP